MDKLGIGIIGCGNISTTYFTLAPKFKGLMLRACADVNMAAAVVKAAEYSVQAQSVEDLLANPAVDVVINLTVPAAHFAISKAALLAGKHVWSEKPLVLSMAEGLELQHLALAGNLRVGCAPDTFLGGAHQFARHMIEEGRFGRIIAGAAAVMGHGMEAWHPNPDFFFLPGGGPMLDMGPYYIANLINLIGPVKRVAALANATFATRTITSAPRHGAVIPVKTATNIHALLEFTNGATVTLSTSWDIWAHKRSHMELYGSEGSVFLPDPNFFGGKVEIAGNDGLIREAALWDHPFAIPNQSHGTQEHANYRSAGLADMAQAIDQNRDHRCSLDRTLHGVEVMLAVLQSGEEGRFITLQTTCTQPAPLGPSEAMSLLT